MSLPVYYKHASLLYELSEISNESSQNKSMYHLPQEIICERAEFLGCISGYMLQFVILLPDFLVQRSLQGG